MSMRLRDEMSYAISYDVKHIIYIVIHLIHGVCMSLIVTFFD